MSIKLDEIPDVTKSYTFRVTFTSNSLDKADNLLNKMSYAIYSYKDYGEYISDYTRNTDSTFKLSFNAFEDMQVYSFFRNSIANYKTTDFDVTIIMYNSCVDKPIATLVYKNAKPIEMSGLDLDTTARDSVKYSITFLSPTKGQFTALNAEV